MIHEYPPEKFDPRFRVVACYVQWDKKFLLLQRHINKSQGGRWGLPAGKIEGEETQREAITRELEEETGLAVAPEKFHHFAKVYVRYPDYDFTFTIFSFEPDAVPAVKINREHQNFKWVSPTDALAMNLVDGQGECVRIFYRI